MKCAPNAVAVHLDQIEQAKNAFEHISILLKVGDVELDEHLARFIDSAGIIVTMADKEVHEDELNQIHSRPLLTALQNGRFGTSYNFKTKRVGVAKVHTAPFTNDDGNQLTPLNINQ